MTLRLLLPYTYPACPVLLPCLICFVCPSSKHPPTLFAFHSNNCLFSTIYILGCLPFAPAYNACLFRRPSLPAYSASWCHLLVLSACSTFLPTCSTCLFYMPVLSAGSAFLFRLLVRLLLSLPIPPAFSACFFHLHSKKITEPMLSNWILHQWHFHWGNTCLFLPPTTCFTVTVNEIRDTQFVLLI